MARVNATERDATRRRLIESGKAEFAARGLAGARFDEISVAAGHAKGTIYNYFASKESLFFTIVEEWCALVSAMEIGAGTARERLLALAAADVEIARKDPELARVVVQQTPALLPRHGEEVLAALSPALDRITDAIHDGQRSGELSSERPPAVLARLFLATVSGFETEALLPDPVIGLDQVVDLVDAHFVEGLRERTP